MGGKHPKFIIDKNYKCCLCGKPAKLRSNLGNFLFCQACWDDLPNKYHNCRN